MPYYTLHNMSAHHHLRGLFKKYPDFFRQKLMKHGMCAVIGRWRGPLCTYVEFFPAGRQHQSRAASMSESVYAERVALLFSAKMMERLKQWYCIKFCQKLGDSQVETIRNIQRVFGDDAMGITEIKEWCNQFRDGRTSVESDACSSRPSTSRNDKLIDQVRTVVMQDSRVTIRQLAEEVEISTGSVHSILTDDLVTRTASAIFVLKLLKMEQKQLSLGVLQDYAVTPEFLNIVTIGDESWVYGMTRKPRHSHHSGNIQHPQGQRPGN